MHQILQDFGLELEHDSVYEDDTAHRTPQQLATEWMTAYDASPLLSSLYSSSSTTSTDVSSSIVQRYVLAVFHFATHPEVREDATTQDNDNRELTSWMTARHVCEWQGIQCEYQDDRDDSDSPAQDYRRIRHVNLASQNLYGSLPRAFMHHIVPDLLELDLSHNQLTGRLPPIRTSSDTDQIVPLELLSLQNNSLTGSIPNDYLGVAATHLYHLDLSQNAFAGTLDASDFWQLWNLRRLYLHDNGDLSGSLPSSLCLSENLGTST